MNAEIQWHKYFAFSRFWKKNEFNSFFYQLFSDLSQKTFANNF